ncbi:Eco57I restriction-modification methylase domain-containing protein [Chryseobacterium culicis]|uniref:site-specific DNA-methyltransferase (adenine-specific) n=1 Tax=Chryseobacterium culicis TaxID=680127 RepID=A0A1H6H235_CHRCI|nr:helicase-related protein [Chryseobacterium culicis]SEH29887.1 Eco57I restriction-modification methylase [Chryseobacterium culicis]
MPDFPREESKTFAENNAHAKLISQLSPHQYKFTEYFEEQGISRSLIHQNTSQVYYQYEGKKYLGVAMSTHSGGFEILYPDNHGLIGKPGISEIKGVKNEMVVFENALDTLSFLRLLEIENRKNTRTLVTLNSAANTDILFEEYKHFDGKVMLCMSSSSQGNDATQRILNLFKGSNVRDVRPLYSISETGNRTLNHYLINKVNNEQKISNFDTLNISKDENTTIKSAGVSESQQVESRISRQSVGESFEESQPVQDRNNTSGQALVGNNAGNGLAGAEWSNLEGGQGGRSATGPQQNDVRENEEEQYSLGGVLGSTTGIKNLDALILQYKEQKITNEQVAEVVSAACFVSDDRKILLKENLIITDDLKDICNQFKSGGTDKKGRGILDEYYTDSKIVDAVRNLIKEELNEKKHIKVLEPSIGTGNFVYAAKGLVAKSEIIGFEINETTAKIAKIFHPETDINLRSFETEFISDTGLKIDPQEFKNRYDLIIGNPPYGDHRGYYKGLGEEPSLSKYEDYFVKRSLDVLKDGGTLAMVLPSGWLNRQKKLNGADITNAFRLPSGTFAGTKIGTDIIILKKNTSKKAQDISGYFEHHQDKVLGEIKERTNQFGRMETYVSGTLDNAFSQIEKILSQNSTERIGNLFEDYFTNNDTIQQVDDPSALLSIEETAQSAIYDKREERKTLLTNAQNKIIEVLQTLNDIKFKSPSVNAEIRKYEKYNKSIDTLSPDQLDKLFKNAEKILQRSTVKNEEYKIQSKPDIKPSILKYQFKKEDSIVAASLQNSSDLSQELLNAFKDTHYDGTLNNHAQHYAFANYIDGRWVHDFYYVAGNIYKKLEQLEKDFSDKNANGGIKDQYEKQKALLESVLPKAKSLEQIIMSPNHEFVHQFHLGTVERLQWNGTSRQSEPTIVKYNLAEKFKDFVRDLPSDAFGGSSSWEVREFVDNESVTGSDKERNALIRERRKEAANDLFVKFIREELSDELKERFVKEFNKNYNNIHVPDYSKFPLFSNIYQNFKGKELRLTEVQKGGIGRMTTKAVGLLAHEVGFGKTLSGILAMHEAMERGNAFRPLIVVPNNSILKQWVDTIAETIPHAKVNILGNLGRDYDLSKFDNKDGEITLVTYEGFNNIGFSNEITERLASRFNYISASDLKGITNSERDFQKELEKDREMQGKMKRGKIYDWQDFGFDHLTFDEAHNANHIVGKVRIEDRRFASDFRSQNQQTSKLGINTWMAAQYIQEQNNGRNVSLLSATPFTNKPLEYYSILSLIANDRLMESGYFNVNTFFETFMEADNDMEIDAKGDVKFKTNVRRFKNNSLFQQLLSEFIDIKGEEDNPELVRPNKFNKEYKIEQNDLTQEQYDLLTESFNDREKGAILTHILNARKIAISPYLSPYYDDENPTVKEFVENSPKLNETMNLIRQNKKDIPESGQIIYSELAVEEFPKLKEYLVQEVGYKPEEVGIITGATSKANRLKIQDDFNSGKIKIVIGSEAIQEGMNLQDNTSDMYLLTLPYNFTSLRQVEGRFWRQGNRHENIRVNFMLTNDSIDVFMLQKLQAKQARYLEAMRKGADVIDVSDINAQELKTAIITNPETRANIEIEILQKKIENEKNKFLADSAFVLRKYDEYTKEKEKVSQAELTYNRIEGYANEGDEKADYWIGQLPHYQRMIELAKADVEKVAQKLIENGVNVTEIEKQTEISKAKIEKLELQIENLPQLREELMSQYWLEKEESLRIAENRDYVKERERENTELFKNKYLDKVVSNKEQNVTEGESKVYSSRKR